MEIPIRTKKLSRYSGSELVSMAFCLCVYSSVTTRFMNYTNLLLIAIAWRFILGNQRFRVSPVAFCWALYIAVYPILDAQIRGGVGLGTFNFLCYFAPLSVFLAGNVRMADFGKTLLIFSKGFAWFQTFGIYLSMTIPNLYYALAARVLGGLPDTVFGFATYTTMAAYVISIGMGPYMIELSLMDESESRRKLFHIVKIFILFSGLILTTKRSFLISTVLSFMIVLVLNSQKSPKKIVTSFLIVVVGVVGVYALSMYFLSIGSHNAFARLGQTFVDINEGEDISNMRWQWAEYMEEWSEGHEVFGIGWESFQDRIKDTPHAGQIPNGHNVYKQIKCEEGYVGLAIFLILVSYTILIGVINILFTIGRSNFVAELSMWSTYMVIVFVIYCYSGNAIYESMIFLYFFGAIFIVSEVNNKLMKYLNSNRILEDQHRQRRTEH